MTGILDLDLDFYFCLRPLFLLSILQCYTPNRLCGCGSVSSGAGVRHRCRQQGLHQPTGNSRGEAASASAIRQVNQKNGKNLQVEHVP